MGGYWDEGVLGASLRSMSSATSLSSELAATGSRLVLSNGPLLRSCPVSCGQSELKATNRIFFWGERGVFQGLNTLRQEDVKRCMLMPPKHPPYVTRAKKRSRTLKKRLKQRYAALSGVGRLLSPPEGEATAGLRRIVF